MKTKLTLLFAIATGLFAQAQNPEVCTETLSLMASSAKAKDPSAYGYLTTLRKDCPSFHNGIYTYGEFGRALNEPPEFHSTTNSWVVITEK